MHGDALSDLVEPDDRTLRFSPLGLGGRMQAADSARFLRDSISQAVLLERVPSEIRDNFERVRKLFLHGVLEYEFFSAATDLAYLVLEGAVRNRFLDYYKGGLPLIRKGEHRTLKVTSFEDVRRARQKKWRLDSGKCPSLLPTSFIDLLAWARQTGLVTERTHPEIDQVLARLRNYSAHPVGYTLHVPPEAAHTITIVADTINGLWA